MVDYYNFIRDLTQEWAMRTATNEKLGGHGLVVECDESKFYRGDLFDFLILNVCSFLRQELSLHLAKYHRGKQLDRERNSGWVFGCIERGSRKVRIIEVSSLISADLIAFLCR